MALKIIHIYKDYEPVLGGIEGHIKTLAQEQAAGGHRVTVAVTNPGGYPSEEIINGVRVVRLARLGTVTSTPISLGFIRFLAEEDYDIAHLQFPYPVGEISLQVAGGDRPYVVSYQSDITRGSQQFFLRLYRPLLWRVLKRASRILVTSPNYLRSSPFLRPLAERCKVVPLGIDAEPYLEVTPTYQRGERPRILFHGRHRYYKGVEVLLQAMRRLDADLWISGDGEMRDQWEKLAGVLGLRERVKFLGNVPHRDLPGLYASADIFVLPSTMRSEAFGIVLLEAMAAGLPCVTTALGTGTSFVVKDGITGFVVAAREVDPLAQAIDGLLRKPDLREQMGAAGRDRVLREFTAAKMAQRVMVVYQKCIRESEKAN